MATHVVTCTPTTLTLRVDQDTPAPALGTLFAIDGPAGPLFGLTYGLRSATAAVSAAPETPGGMPATLVDLMLVGYEQDGAMRQRLPHVAPMPGALARPMAEEELLRFHHAFEYLRYPLSLSLPYGDDLIAATLEQAYRVRPDRAFLLAAARALAGLLADDHERLVRIMSGLDVWMAPERAAPGGETLGVITRGSLGGGLELRLDPSRSVEDLRVGRFVVVEGREARFFGLVTDLALDSRSASFLHAPPPAGSLAREALQGHIAYGVAEVTPMLALPRHSGAGIEPVRTIPEHFSAVVDATHRDVAAVFGEAGASSFAVGSPLNMDAPISIDLERLVERSNGVFGKSGTGKSFLTRLLLAGVIATDVASVLVFDMHTEYGWEATSEESSVGTVAGLRRLFGARVHAYALDREAAQARDAGVDGYLDVALADIEIEDIALLGDELGISSAMLDTCYLLHRQFGATWLNTLLDQEPGALKAIAAQATANSASLAAAYRKLARLRRYGFLRAARRGPDRGVDTVGEIMGHLRRGDHVVLEFGRYRDPLAYMLVANIITRRIHRAWIEQTEHYLLTKRAADRPRRLLLCIEEAHKFLNPGAIKNTSFGAIAREMRKYNVTLLVVDQRPSGIDAEVTSQLGTRFTALLTEESDIRAAVAGVAGSEHLRGVLASLDTKRQALVAGHAVPMPVVVRVRPYDPAFFDAVRPRAARRRPARPSGMAALQEAFDG